MRATALMALRASPREHLLHAGRILALAVIYVALGRIGPALIPMHGVASLVWPGSGVCLAALVLGGYSLWPGVAIGALATQLAIGAPPGVALAIAAGSTLEAVVGTYALRRIPGFHGSLDRLIDVLGLIVLAGIASSMMAATVGAVSVAVGRTDPLPFFQTWVVWWTGDLMGILIVTPLLLTWLSGPRPSRSLRDLAEAALVGVALIGGSALLFSQPQSTPWLRVVLPHVLLLPMLCAAIRFGMRGAATGIFILAVASVWGTYRGFGFFARPDVVEGFSTLQVFLFTAAIAKLVLGAVVSEQARTQQSLRESEERQRLAIEAAQLGMWCWNLRSGDLLWSPKCRQLHDVGEDEAVTYDRFLEAVCPDDRDRVADTVKAAVAAVAAHAEHRAEYRVLWRDGSAHWISVFGRVFLDEVGKPARMLGVALDITQQKEAERDRGDLLEREQAARAEAQAATRAKDDFLAVLSHELRTPLQSILGWTQMLRERPYDARSFEKGLATIDRNGKAQAQLIEDLLDISRIVAGKLRLAHVRVDLVDVVASAIEVARSAADRRGVEIDVANEDMVGEVLGDPDRLLQVISNLLSNAVKFTPAGGHVTVRIDRRSITARLSVTDTGAGISSEFLPYVFDRFRQAESTTQRAHGGLGLGLAIVRHLVELHGGTVMAASPGVGRGATFTVTLPLISVARSAITLDRRQGRRTSSRTPVALDGIRVLVVDDDLDACEVLVTALNDSGASVRAVHSVRAALAELDSFHPDLLLSDIGMPEEDGYALIREVREREQTRGGHLPAVALTAFASQSDREQALALGFEEHLAKPTSPSELSRAVARLVGRAA